jgi:hypothetical protein
MTDLNPPGADFSQADDINPSGDIVGWIRTATAGQVTLWTRK